MLITDGRPRSTPLLCLPASWHTTSVDFASRSPAFLFVFVFPSKRKKPELIWAKLELWCHNDWTMMDGRARRYKVLHLVDSFPGNATYLHSSTNGTPRFLFVCLFSLLLDTYVSIQLCFDINLFTPMKAGLYKTKRLDLRISDVLFAEKTLFLNVFCVHPCK